MTRREFITLLGGAAAWPVAARAQQAATEAGLVFSLDAVTPANSVFDLAVPRGMRELGYVEGKRCHLRSRRFSRNGRFDRLSTLACRTGAAESRRHVYCGRHLQCVAAQQATATIPIVMDAIQSMSSRNGFVASLSRPGGNVDRIYQAPRMSSLDLLRLGTRIISCGRTTNRPSPNR